MSKIKRAFWLNITGITLVSIILMQHWPEDAIRSFDIAFGFIVGSLFLYWDVSKIYKQEVEK